MIQISPETQAFVLEHQTDDVRTLALQAKKYPGIDMPTAITQIAGRQIAATKVPSWSNAEGIWYPKHLSMEQCSSETTARYKTKLLSGSSLTDLTGGFGIDCAFLATGFQRVTYVERQEELCEIAAHNFPLLGLSHISICHEDGVDYLQKMSQTDCIFLDPARRDEHGGKIVAIADCEPDVARLETLLLAKAKRVMIKLSPMLDLSLALQELPHTMEAHIISVDNECKELLLILGNNPPAHIPIHCINLSSKRQEPQLFTFTREQESLCECTYADSIGQFLYEPNASLLKGGAYKSLAQAYSLAKLHPNSHLYTSDTLQSNFPGRIFRVNKQYGFGKKEMKEMTAEVKKANITVRNFPSSTNELRKRLKLQEGGNVYLFATTLYNNTRILIHCSKISLS